MRSNTRVSYPLLWTFLVTVLWLSGCSSSSEHNGIATDAAIDDTTPANDDPTKPPAEISPTAPEQTPADDAPSSTRVDFDITVPVYFSNALQVRLIWGETDTNANWIVGQSWTVSMELPTNTEHLLSVTFSDDNGSTPLGTFETQFKTGSATTETYSITADQFDTDRWDDDADGISNLDEGNSADITQPVPVTLELIRDKTFRIHWERNAAADYYRVLENPDGVSGFTPITENLSANTDFFDHRVALHKRTNARYMVEACNATACTNSVQHLIEGSLEEAIGYFKASNAEKNDYFGSDVSLSDDGNTLAISASSEDSATTGINGNQADNSSIDAGAVYIFQRINGSWVQQAYLKASNPDTLDDFGYSLSLSADGNTLAVGAVGEASDANGVNGDQTDNSVPKSGAVYVFSRTGTQWQQTAYIKANNSDEHDWFGYNVRLSSDAKTLAVSAIDENSSATGINGDESNNDHYRAGAVYVFESVNGEWEQQAYIKGEVAYINDRFGIGLDLSGDGNTIAIGVYDDSLVTDRSLATRGADYNTYWGAVYVYVRRSASWEKEAFLRANSDYLNNFGLSVRLSEDGNLLAASANNSLMVFKRSGGVWTNEAQLFGSNSVASDRFGSRFSLSADGSTIAVGAFEEDSASTGLNGYEGDEISEENSGAAYVFTQDAGVWTQQAYVKASNTQRWTFFGTALALNANGDTLAIASDWERSSSSGINGAQITEETATTAGAVYLY